MRGSRWRGCRLVRLLRRDLHAGGASRPSAPSPQEHGQDDRGCHSQPAEGAGGTRDGEAAVGPIALPLHASCASALIASHPAAGPRSCHPSLHLFFPLLAGQHLHRLLMPHLDRPHPPTTKDAPGPTPRRGRPPGTSAPLRRGRRRPAGYPFTRMVLDVKSRSPHAREAGCAAAATRPVATSIGKCSSLGRTNPSSPLIAVTSPAILRIGRSGYWLVSRRRAGPASRPNTSRSAGTRRIRNS